MASVYQLADIMIYPSIFEGFGIPILEAFSYGKAIVTSNVSSMPEVGKDAALYFDPEDPKSICEAITSLMNENKRNELVHEYKLLGFNINTYDGNHDIDIKTVNKLIQKIETPNMQNSYKMYWPVPLPQKATTQHPKCNDVLFLHYKVQKKLLRKLVPNELELDNFD